MSLDRRFAGRHGQIAPPAAKLRKAGRNLSILRAMLQCGNVAPPQHRFMQHRPTGGIVCRREILAPVMHLGFNLNKMP
jgi:hypothetical protein